MKQQNGRSVSLSRYGIKSIPGWRPVVKYFTCPYCHRRTGLTKAENFKGPCSWCGIILDVSGS